MTDPDPARKPEPSLDRVPTTEPVTAEIRPASRADAASIFALTRGFATSFVPDRSAFDDSLESLLADPATCVTVAESEGRVIGYLLAHRHLALFANGPLAWVEEVVVAEDHRREGLGERLMREAERWAREAGCRYIALATRRAAGFYAAVGYEESAAFYRRML